MKKVSFLKGAVIMSLVLTAACTSYPIAQDIKMVSFDDNVAKGQSVGPIRGEDCVWSVMGYEIGGKPTLDKAMASARTQTGSGITDTFKSSKNSMNTNVIRYMDNVSTDRDGFNAVFVGKQCLIVKGTGYK
jgi:hypothetical protein